VTVPTFRQYNPQGQWFAEGHGVEPDIRVDENPTELAKGRIRSCSGRSTK
jgi:tricorn protease